MASKEALLPHQRVLVGVALLGAVTLPLATYAVTLAVFGAAHVLAELRYVVRRFGARVGRRTAGAMLGGVLAIGCTRALMVAGVLPPAVGRLIELGFGVALALAVVPAASSFGRVTAVGSACLVAVGLWVSAVHTLLLVAVLHNLTPVLFVAEGRAADRAPLRRALLLFVAVPVLIASGMPYAMLHPLGVVHPELSPLTTGGLVTHMRAYLPSAWIGTTAALHAFSACAYLQCMHYLYVVDVLPARVGGAGSARWKLGLVALSVVSVVAFVGLGFATARNGYGALAAIHAWLELPILLLALTSAKPQQPDEE